MGEVVDSESNIREVVATFDREAANARRQWSNWLGVGGGGGVLALLSFSANLPDPDRALHMLAPAIAAFVLGIVFAAPALLTQAQEFASAGRHYAEAHNRDVLQTKIAATPQWLSSPQSMADEMNAGRNAMIGRSNAFHEAAETAWRHRVRWKWVTRIAMSLSAACFLIGATYPLWLIASDHHLVQSAVRKNTR